MKEFRLKPGGIQDKFLASRKKVQIFGGGFGNGKTTAVIVKMLTKVAFDYPGCNILIARSTFPKLNDTVRKEFISWCPKDEIASFPMSVNASNTCTLKNGTTINFRYIAQQGKSVDDGTSNLLSATYDLIIVDQMEDPEIVHKDFTDLLGRLRGSTPYKGDDPTMPRTGPRWIWLTANPTRNWFYQKIIKPFHTYKRTGVVEPDLLCWRSDDGITPLYNDDGSPRLMMDLVEGGTAENAHNLDDDFIQALNSTYTGQQRDRYLKGEWAAYEGLVYPTFNPQLHLVSVKELEEYLLRARKRARVEWIEAYDYGITSPSCYLLAFTDEYSNVFIIDGYYKREFELTEQYAAIRATRKLWDTEGSVGIYADPAIFRRSGASSSHTIADDFWINGRISVQKADNAIESGIGKVSSYLTPRRFHLHPFQQINPAPSLHINEELTFISDEFSSYYWRKDHNGYTDKPQDTDDHAMDTIKYLFTGMPNASILLDKPAGARPSYMKWRETEDQYNG